MVEKPLPSWDEADLVMISALEHWSYCPRQCALIHVEQAWDENLYTLRGRIVHGRTDTPEGEQREGVRIERALPLWSDPAGQRPPRPRGQECASSGHCPCGPTALAWSAGPT